MVPLLVNVRRVSGTSCQAVGDSRLVCAGERISFEDLVADDNFMLFFLPPEVADDDKSRKLLRDLCRRGRIAGLMVDEVHLGLTGHWFHKLKL